MAIEENNLTFETAIEKLESILKGKNHPGITIEIRNDGFINIYYIEYEEQLDYIQNIFEYIIDN